MLNRAEAFGAEGGGGGTAGGADADGIGGKPGMYGGAEGENPLPLAAEWGLELELAGGGNDASVGYRCDVPFGLGDVRLDTLVLRPCPFEDEENPDEGGEVDPKPASGPTRRASAPPRPEPENVPPLSRLVRDEADGDDSGRGTVYGSEFARALREEVEKVDCGGGTEVGA